MKRYQIRMMKKILFTGVWGVSKLGVPTREEIERLLEPRGQTVRGTGVGGAAGG